MKLIIGLFLIYLAAAGQIYDLDDTNFEHDTQAATGSTTGDWFVLFYATWCGHCKRLKPTWEDMAEQLSAEPVQTTNVARVDCDQAPSTCERFGIRGFPTMKMIAHGKVVKYGGKRKVEDLLDFATGGWKEAESEPVPEELTGVKYIWSLMEKFSSEMIFMVDQAIGEMGYGHLPGWIKVAIALAILLAPAVCIVSCIFWCESRQAKQFEREANLSAEEQRKLEKKLEEKANKKKKGDDKNDTDKKND